MILAAEFFTAGDVDILQQVSISPSVYVKEWQNRDILCELDRETWKGMSEDFHTHTHTSGQLSPALGRRHSCLDPANNAHKKSTQKCVAETGQDGIQAKVSTRNHLWPGVQVNVVVT